MDIIEYIKNSVNLFVYNEDNAYNNIIEKTTYKEPFIFLLLISILGSILTYSINYNLIVVPLLNNPITLIFAIIGLLFAIPLGFGLYMLFGLITHGLLKLFGGQAEANQTIKLYLSTFVLIFIFDLLSSLIPLSIMSNELYNLIYIGILSIFGLIFLIWTFIVYLRVFSKLHNISKFKVFLAFIIPMLVIFLILIILLIIATFMSEITYF